MTVPDIEEQLAELDRQTSAISMYSARVRELPALLEPMARLAESAGQHNRAFWYRLNLAGAYFNLDMHEQAMITLSACIAAVDQDPHPTPKMLSAVLHHGTSIAQSLSEVPTISRAEIVRLLDDLEERTRRAGRSLRTIAEVRQYVLMRMGDLDGAAAAFNRWRALPRADSERMSTEIEEIDGIVEWFLAIGRDSDALAAAAPLLSGEIPAATPDLAHTDDPAAMQGWIFVNCLAPLVRVGRYDDAARAHRLGLPLAVDHSGKLPMVARHLIYVAATAQLAAALPLLERHLPLAAGLTEHARYELDSATWLVMAAAERLGHRQLTLRLPEWHPGHEPSGWYDTANLAGRMAASVRALAARYDARNGNTYVSAQLQRSEALLDINHP